MNRTTRWVLLVAAVVALAGCGGAGDSPDLEGDQTSDEDAGSSGDAAGQDSPDVGADSDQTTSSPEDTNAQAADVQASLEVRGGQVVGGVERVEADVGDIVALTVTSDVADHVHVHGYDLETPVSPGKPAEVTFQADIPGVFEVELEDRGLEIAELVVGA